MKQTIFDCEKRYGRLLVINELPRHTVPSGVKIRKFLCKCECGQELDVFMSSLRSGHTKSCGCLNKEIISSHGMTGTREYASWNAMHGRCNNLKSKDYKNWGGRGIEVCDSWNSFENFYKDMGDKPTPNHSIERINNDGNYCKENCRWATKKEQQRNHRGNKVLSFEGLSLTVAEWVEKTGVTRAMIDYRLAKGFSMNKVLSQQI